MRVRRIGFGRDWLGEARRGPARFGRARFLMTNADLHHEAWRGTVGAVRLGLVRPGEDGPGWVWRGKVFDDQYGLSSRCVAGIGTGWIGVAGRA